MNVAVLLGVFCTFFAGSIAKDKPPSDGYIFTSPRTLNFGANNELHLQRFGNQPAGNLKVEVIYKENYSSNETVGAVQDFRIPAGEKYSTLNLPLNKVNGYRYGGRIQINGTFGKNKISGSESISFSSPNQGIIIIQTDKGIYKPGQTVHFRILKMNSELKPTTVDPIAQVHIEDPKGNRLAQYNDLDLTQCIVQEEFILANEPEQGRWTITVSTNNTSESTSFTVKEYVLPKFEVTIKFPPFVLANAEYIPVDICAKYTYGKPVSGTLKLNASLESYYYYGSDNKYPTLQETIKLDGCYTYVVNVSMIEPNNTYTSRSIQIKADFTEAGTGVQKLVSQSFSRQTSPLSLRFIDQRNYYKLGLPFNGKLQVTNPDGTPAPDEPIEICATIDKQRILAEWMATKTLQFCKNYTSDTKGMIKYTLISTNIDEISIRLNAKSTKYLGNNSRNRTDVLNQPQTSTSLSPFFSPSSSYLQLQPVHQPVPCGTKQSFKVLFTAEVNQDYTFYYQVVKQSDVVIEKSIDVSFSNKDNVFSQYNNGKQINSGDGKQTEPSPDKFSKAENNLKDCPAAIDPKFSSPIGEVSIDIDIDSTLSSNFRLLVYYVRGDRETVADSQKIDVQKCLKNKVDFSFGDKIQQPGLQTSVEVRTIPLSICGIKAVDKSVSLLDNSDQLTLDSVFQRLQRFDTNNYYPSNPCYGNGVQPGLENANFIVRTPPGYYPSSSYDDSFTSFQASGFLVISNMLLFTRPCRNNEVYHPNFPLYDSGSIPGPQGKAIQILPAGPGSTPGTVTGPDGNFQLISLPTSSVKNTRDYFPETWLFDLKLVGPSGSYSGKETLPDTITEWIGSAVCLNTEVGLGISNTSSITAFQAFFIDYTLPVSVIRGEEVTIVVSISNYADGALPISVGLEGSDGFVVTGHSVDGAYCLQHDSTLTLPISMKATKVGNVNITVRAESAGTNKVCGNSKVSSSYARDAITKQLLVEAEGFPQEDVKNYLFCPSDEKNKMYDEKITLTVPGGVVPDSQRAYFDFTGNVLGKAIKNLNSLVDLPTGCGEQNMVKFTPNYVVLDYLTSVGMLTDDIKYQAISNLNIGYQQELNYRHNDGSFSAFGDVDKKGSIFLTSFVLRSFYQAKRYIYVSDKIIKQMQDWIVSKQEPDGSFPNTGPLIDIGLEGGLGNEKSSGSITAYVLTSLFLSDFNNVTITNKAFTYLKKNPPANPYATVLYAYAQAVAGNKKEAMKLLDQARQRLNSKGGMESFIIVNGTKATSIEADGYAILATLKAGGTPADVLPYVRYLASNLNPYGGFQSTQDTCVGLEALAQFAEPVFKEPLDIKAKTTGSLVQTVDINDKNKLLEQRFKVSKVPSEVEVKATGTGCGLLQTSIRYNTITPPETRTFSLEVNGNCLDVNCTNATMNVLVSYLPPDQKSGMSIVQVKLITGFVPDRDSLTKLKRQKSYSYYDYRDSDSNSEETSRNSKNILRIDVQNNNVIFYLSEISNAVETINFNVLRVVRVRNAQPGQAKVYDYYANENTASTSYTIKGLASANNSVEDDF